VLNAWPAVKLDLEGLPLEPGHQRYRFSSRTTRAQWIVDVRTLVADRRLRTEFGRVGESPQGWAEYDLEPGPEGTTVRSRGEVRVNRLLAAVNALLGRHLENPDRDLDGRVQRWLAANPDISRQPGDINER
jgi:hypothetical protein